MMPTFCPVCGYDLALSDPDALPEPCPCCAFDFKRFNTPKSYNYFVKGDSFDMAPDVWRDGWRESHLPWYSKTVPKPEGWDPIVQLKNIKLNWGNSYEEWMEQHPAIIPENKDKFLKLARERIRKLGWQPEFIEALWDGDTQGWMLDVWVSAKRADGKYNMESLRTLRGRGGDFRLFAGTVPPFPEVVIARYLLDEISKELGIPSYFPSEAPDDSYARFWGRDENYRCRTCGKYLYVSAIIKPKDQCRTCQRREEQAKKST